MAERQTVALDVVGSTPTTHPNFFLSFSGNASGGFSIKTGDIPSFRLYWKRISLRTVQGIHHTFMLVTTT